eukprot:TRINITY_DN1300_c0_g1_i2.p1 TRINITY_DN1300_c0_g1~~TRINITY_DN1300_c0_g1_i2.p1  ORF type:complete len:149 (+),score=26.34 TRINITY_DN1300_c0_g1_i2:96-542(+)
MCIRDSINAEYGEFQITEMAITAHPPLSSLEQRLTRLNARITSGQLKPSALSVRDRKILAISQDPTAHRDQQAPPVALLSPTEPTHARQRVARPQHHAAMADNKHIIEVVNRQHSRARVGLEAEMVAYSVINPYANPSASSVLGAAAT